MNFDFGNNWKKYSEKYLTETELNSAKESLKRILGEDGLKGKSFLDIGCGTGLFAICACLLGSNKVIGIDINRKCIETSEDNSKRFIKNEQCIEYFQISILDDDKLESIGKYDMVYAWGSLHHTGNMWKAIDNSSKLVANGGLLWLAIYNRHITSPVWKIIKKYFNKTNKYNKVIIANIYLFLLLMARIVPNIRNNFKKRRGMSLYYDAIDWLGGYPYEYASPNEIIKYFENINFEMINFSPTLGFTGCNEYLFQKNTKF